MDGGREAEREERENEKPQVCHGREMGRGDPKGKHGETSCFLLLLLLSSALTTNCHSNGCAVTHEHMNKLHPHPLPFALPDSSLSLVSARLSCIVCASIVFSRGKKHKQCFTIGHTFVHWIKWIMKMTINTQRERMGRDVRMKRTYIHSLTHTQRVNKETIGKLFYLISVQLQTRLTRDAQLQWKIIVSLAPATLRGDG